MKIILGSSSRWRRELMRQIVPEFEVLEPNIDERAIVESNPQVLTMKIAKAKSKALWPRVTEPAIILTADQVVVCNGVIRGKPLSESEARDFLWSYRRYPAEYVNALYAYNTVTKRDVIAVDFAKVYCKGLTEQAIEDIIKQKLVFTRAGGCDIGHPSFDAYVERIEGSVDSALGLPLNLTRLLIQDVGGVLP